MNSLLELHSEHLHDDAPPDAGRSPCERQAAGQSTMMTKKKKGIEKMWVFWRVGMAAIFYSPGYGRKRRSSSLLFTSTWKTQKAGVILFLLLFFMENSFFNPVTPWLSSMTGNNTNTLNYCPAAAAPLQKHAGDGSTASQMSYFCRSSKRLLSD